MTEEEGGGIFRIGFPGSETMKKRATRMDRSPQKLNSRSGRHPPEDVALPC